MGAYHEYRAVTHEKPAFMLAQPNEARAYPALQGAARISIQEALSSEADETAAEACQFTDRLTSRSPHQAATAILDHFNKLGVEHPHISAVDQYLGIIGGGWRRGNKITPEGAFQTLSRPMPEDDLDIQEGSFLDNYIAEGGELRVCGKELEIRSCQLHVSDLRAALAINHPRAFELLAAPQGNFSEDKSEKAAISPPDLPAPQRRWLARLLGAEGLEYFVEITQDKRDVFARRLGEMYKSLSIKSRGPEAKAQRASQLALFLSGKSYKEAAETTADSYTGVLNGLNTMPGTLLKRLSRQEIVECLVGPDTTPDAEENIGGSVSEFVVVEPLDLDDSLTVVEPKTRQTRPEPRSLKKPNLLKVGNSFYPPAALIEEKGLRNAAIDAVALGCQLSLQEKGSHNVQHTDLNLAIKWLEDALSKPIRRICNRYYDNARVNSEDMKQVIREHMITSLIPQFDPGRGTFYAHFVSSGWRRVDEAVGRNASQLSTPAAFLSLDKNNPNKIRAMRAASYDDARTFEDKAELGENDPDSILVGTSKDPAEALVSKILLGDVRGIVQGVSSLERAAFDCLVMDLSYEEVAKKVGVNTKSVDNAVQRLRKKLARAL